MESEITVLGEISSKFNREISNECIYIYIYIYIYTHTHKRVIQKVLSLTKILGFVIHLSPT